MDTLSALATVLAVMSPFFIITGIGILVIAGIWYLVKKL